MIENKANSFDSEIDSIHNPTESYLVNQYGVLMNMNQLAELLGRSYHALHSFLYSKSPEAQQLNDAKKRIGRCVYFRTIEIAKFLEQ